MSALEVSIVAEQERYTLGEAVWVDLVVENGGAAPFGTIVAVKRRGPLHVRVTDAAGNVVRDPVNRSGGWGRAAGPSLRAAPGARAAVAFDLAGFARLEAPGTYTVRVIFPDDAEPLADDPRWDDVPGVQVTLLAPAPDDLERIVLAHPKGPDAVSLLGSWGRVDGYDALGHAVFVPVLERLAAASRVADPSAVDPVDERALAGLAACPCAEATEALMRLHLGLADPALRERVAGELLVRMPLIGPTAPSAWFDREEWFRAAAWDARFDAPMLERARASLAVAPTAEGWEAAWEWGARVVAALGGERDVPALAAALDRASAVGADRAADALRGALRASPGAPVPPGATLATRLVIAASGPLPPDLLVPALASADPQVALGALEHLDAVPSPDAATWVALHLGSPNPRLADAAFAAVLRYPDPSYRDAILERIDAADGRVMGQVWDAAAAVGIPADERLARFRARQAADPAPEIAAILADDGSGRRDVGAHGSGAVP